MTYDPEIQGRSISDKEIKKLAEFKTDNIAYSVDEPELTEELAQRMKRLSKKPIQMDMPVFTRG